MQEIKIIKQEEYGTHNDTFINMKVTVDPEGKCVNNILSNIMSWIKERNVCFNFFCIKYTNDGMKYEFGYNDMRSRMKSWR